MKIAFVIPFSNKSSRFPCKIYKNFLGKPIWENVVQGTKDIGLGEVFVMTDSFLIPGIRDTNRASCGSERAYNYFLRDPSFDWYISIPGDEPLVPSAELRRILGEIGTWNRSAVHTCHCRFFNYGDVFDRRSCKMIVSKSGRVAYFSRSVIPGSKDGYLHPLEVYCKHYAMMAFHRDLLDSRDLWDGGEAEGLEQNKFLLKGVPVVSHRIEHIGFGIDTPDQLPQLEERVRFE